MACNLLRLEARPFPNRPGHRQSTSEISRGNMVMLWRNDYVGVRMGETTSIPERNSCQELRTVKHPYILAYGNNKRQLPDRAFCDGARRIRAYRPTNKPGIHRVQKAPYYRTERLGCGILDQNSLRALGRRRRPGECKRRNWGESSPRNWRCHTFSPPHPLVNAS
jgi:hypothetical protein